MALRTWRAHPSACTLVGVALLLLPLPSSSQGLPVELRFHAPGGAFRWSSDIPDVGPPTSHTDSAERSFHLSPGLGVRIYPNEGHGAFADVAYQLDVDADGIVDESSWRVHYFLVRGGYAHRSVFLGRRHPERLARVVTVSAGMATGYARSEHQVEGMPELSPVLGPTVALDYDAHVGRYFFGWGLSSDFLVHTRGPMRFSGFLSGSVLPFLRLGVTFGPRIHAAPSHTDERGEPRNATDGRATPRSEVHDGA